MSNKWHRVADEHPNAVQAAKDLIPKERVPAQRQDSLTAQMVTVMELVRRTGCYDAQDFLRRKLG